MSKDSLGDRMKTYENTTRHYLPIRMPAIIRLDGKAFHTLTKGFHKPFDTVLMRAMWETAKYLCKNIQGCQIAYTQSDEISLLLTDYEKHTTSAWFNKNIQKMVSVSASMATLAFNNALWDVAYDWKENEYIKYPGDEGKTDRLKIVKDYTMYTNKAGTALFDSRVFVVPKEDVCNYFIWRQKDATRNAIESVGQANFSHKELDKVNQNQIQEKLFQEKGINFNDFPVSQKRGVCVSRQIFTNEKGALRSAWVVDENIPIFTQDREYIERYLGLDTYDD